MPLILDIDDEFLVGEDLFQTTPAHGSTALEILEPEFLVHTKTEPYSIRSRFALPQEKPRSNPESR